MLKSFIIIARYAPENGVIYLYDEVHVEARNWEEAYQTLRDNNYSPFVDNYTPKPSAL